MDLNLSIKTNWNDLTAFQVERICWALHCNIAGKKDGEDPQIVQDNKILDLVAFQTIAKELLRGNPYGKIKKLIKEIHPNQLIPFTEFIFAGVDLQRFPKSFKIRDKKDMLYELHGPYFKLKTCSMGEFSFADSLYYRWRSSGESIFLDFLCGVLYRPRIRGSEDPDPRRPYDKVKAEFYTGLFENVPLEKKLPVAFAFEGCRNYLVSLYPRVFPKRAPQKLEPGQKPRPAKYVPFGELISNKINFDPSKIDQVESLNIYRFFAIYENELKEIAKIKRQRK